MRLASKLVLPMLLTTWLVTPAFSESTVPSESIMVFGGWATETNFTELFYAPQTIHLNDIGVIGAAYSRRLGTGNELAGDLGLGDLGDDLSVESEIGTSARFGDESLGEVWVALYLRYDGLPWNETIYSTIALNTGLSLLTDLSDFEEGRDKNGESSELLHYLGPEITFADPDAKDLEMVIRLHHRSGVFGLFDGVVSGSTFISSGIRVRF